MFLEMWALGEMLDDHGADNEGDKIHRKSERDRILNFKFHCTCGHEMDQHDEDGCNGENSLGFMKGKEPCNCDYQKDRQPVTFANKLRRT